MTPLLSLGLPTMPYLLSLLGSEATLAGSKHHLCCYTNDTVNIQLIRECKAGECLWRRVVFPGERVLFTALPESALEIRTPLNASVSLRRVPCQRLCLHAGLKTTPVAAAVDMAPAPVTVTGM